MDVVMVGKMGSNLVPRWILGWAQSLLPAHAGGCCAADWFYHHARLVLGERVGARADERPELAAGPRSSTDLRDAGSWS